MATHAEVANGALRQVVQLLLELVEHWRHGRVGVRRDTPVFVDLLVTLRTFAGRGGVVLGEQFEMWIDARFGAAGWCCGGRIWMNLGSRGVGWRREFIG